MRTVYTDAIDLNADDTTTCPHCEIVARQEPSRWRCNFPGLVKYDCDNCGEIFFVREKTS